MNLADMLMASAERAGDKPALIFRDRPISYRELQGAVAQAAGALAGAGGGQGARVAILAGNVPEFVYALHGTRRAGAVAVPLYVLATAGELASLLGDGGARA